MRLQNLNLKLVLARKINAAFKTVRVATPEPVPRHSCSSDYPVTLDSLNSVVGTRRVEATAHS
jgi:hypothetical protein